MGEETLVTVSTYADEIKSNPAYRAYNSWHYVNIPPGESYGESPVYEGGDLVQGIQKCQKILESDTASKSDKIFYLKLLIHFIGDLHQPLHCGRAEDKGGNDIQVRWYSTGTNLHSVWDTKMIESYGMSYSELTNNYGMLNKDLYKTYKNENLLDWVNESRGLALEVYNSVDKGDKLTNSYLYAYWDVVTKQLEKGGIRLAVMLNEIFD